MNPRLFITGIPTAGKSYLGKKLAKEVGGLCISTDDLREELGKDPNYKQWVNFYFDQDEFAYYTSTNYEEQWENLVRQSENLWPGILAAIQKYKGEKKPVIFEGVNILPHLAAKDLPFRGMVLIGKSYDETLHRITKEHRWGKTKKLQALEADAFFNGERAHYKTEGEKCGYPIFETPGDAWETTLQLFTK